MRISRKKFRTFFEIFVSRPSRSSTKYDVFYSFSEVLEGILDVDR